MKYQQHVTDQWREILSSLKSRFPVYHLSNIFLRDIQYGIQEYFAQRGARVTYAQAENLTRAFVDRLEREKIFIPIDAQTWVVHYPEFRKPVVKTAAPAKPAAAVPGTAAASNPVGQPQAPANG